MAEISLVFQIGSMKTSKIISLVLIVFLLNVDMIFTGIKSFMASDNCSCSISQKMCDFSNICCCPTKGVTSWQTKPKNQINKTEAYICSLSCGENQTRILPVSSAKPYILVDHPVLTFNRWFLFYEPFPFKMQTKYIGNPPDKPPQKLI
jgi:hypothetical protein